MEALGMAISVVRRRVLLQANYDYVVYKQFNFVISWVIYILAHCR